MPRHGLAEGGNVFHRFVDALIVDVVACGFCAQDEVIADSFESETFCGSVTSPEQENLAPSTRREPAVPFRRARRLPVFRLDGLEHFVCTSCVARAAGESHWRARDLRSAASQVTCHCLATRVKFNRELLAADSCTYPPTSRG
jgi:hypothetical protein